MPWHDWLIFVDVWLSAGFAVEWNSCNLHAGKVTAIYFPGSSAQRCKWPGLVATSSQAFPPSCVVHISMGAMGAYHSLRSSVVIALVGCGCLMSFHPFRAKDELIQKRWPLAIRAYPCFFSLFWSWGSIICSFSSSSIFHFTCPFLNGLTESPNDLNRKSPH